MEKEELEEGAELACVTGSISTASNVTTLHRPFQSVVFICLSFWTDGILSLSLTAFSKLEETEARKTPVSLVYRASKLSAES